MSEVQQIEAPSEGKSWLILQSLLCLLREKNLLSRSDIEELCEKVELRAKGETGGPLPCRAEHATIAATEMSVLGDYIGRRYGGKHRRTQ